MPGTASILYMWKNCFSQLLDVHNISKVRQIEIHMAEPLAPGPAHLEVEIPIAMLKKYKFPGSDQILADLIQAGGEILILFGIRKSCLISGRSLFYTSSQKG
jgi:hypothetical protein